MSASITSSGASSMLADLMAFLDASPSPFHVAATVATRLQAAGFTEVSYRRAWSQREAPDTQVPAAGFVRRDGAIVAWRVGTSAATDAPFVIVGGHTDSPTLRVKPHPDGNVLGWQTLGVEVYGGILNNSWLDRDLGLAGRVITANGDDVLVNVDRPVARVPQLAVHLDRGVNENGLKLDPQHHLTAVWGSAAAQPGDFAEWIADEAGVDSGNRVVAWEIGLYDVQRAAVLGADRSMLAAGRLDNQLTCWAATDALIGASPDQHVAVIVLNDHEEVGSASTTGAAGAFFGQVLERLVIGRGGDRESYLRGLARSACISSDNAHAVHPNYAERHDPNHRPLVNNGPAIKLNVNQRYATTAATQAWFAAGCDAVDVPHQVFVSRNDMPCGSTIGPITAARLGVDTVDVGIPQLSMHSTRELCGVEDPASMAMVLRHLLGSGSPHDAR